MNLENSLYKTDQFVELEPIIENVREDISFWGDRYVYIQGSDDRFPIDILAKRIIELMKKTKFEFNDEERAAGKKIAAKIDQIYADNDKRLEGKWFITQILCYIWDNLRDGGYTPRFYWEDRENEAFDRYTASQYKEKFNHSPSKMSSMTWYRDIGYIELYYPPDTTSDDFLNSYSPSEISKLLKSPVTQ